MAFSLGELVWKITGDTSGINRALDSTDKQVKKSGSGINRALDSTDKQVKKSGTGFSKLAGIIKSGLIIGAVVYAGKKLYDFGKSVVKNSGQAQRSLDQLNQVIKSTGGVAGVTSEELVKMATDLSNVTEFEDDAIIKSQALLLTFTKIGKDVFPDATEAILNLSAALGQDLQASTVQIGKALNDPIQGITALRRVGVQLSASQEEQIKNFVALNDVASAQKIILSELSTHFGGTAKAVFANNPALMFAKAQQQIGNILEKVGEEQNSKFLALGQAMVVASMDGGILSKTLSVIGKGLGAVSKQLAEFTFSLEKYNRQKDFEKGADKSIEQNKKLADTLRTASTYAKKYGDGVGTYTQQLQKMANAGDLSAISLLQKITQYTEESKKLNKEADDSYAKYSDVEQKMNEFLSDSVENQKEINDYLKDRAKLLNNVSDNQKKVDTKEELNKAKENANALSKAFKSATKEQITFIEASRGIKKENLDDTLDSLDKYPPAIKDAVKGFNELSVEEIKALEEATNLYKSGKISLDQYNILWGSLAEKAKSYYDIIGAMPTAQLEKVSAEIGNALNKSQSFSDVWDEMDFKQKTQFIADQFNQMGQSIGNVFSAVAEYVEASYQAQIDALDNAMKAELEAAGIHEETATEKAEADLARAKESGDAEAILEAEKALKKAKIEEKYQKKKAELEYQMELARWKFSMASAAAAIPLSIMNALASGFQAPWFMLPWFPVAMASLAGASSAIQFAAVAKSKPEAPKFENGGIVGGQSYSGDNVTARVNSGELILNRAQQNNLAGQMSNISVRVVSINEDAMYKELYQASKDGRLMISDRSLVAI